MIEIQSKKNENYRICTAWTLLQEEYEKQFKRKMSQTSVDDAESWDSERFLRSFGE